MRTYEVLFILSPQVAEEEATTLINDFKRVAETTGAQLRNEEAWGRRRLAYPIQKFTEGNYHLFVFESDGSPSELDRRMKKRGAADGWHIPSRNFTKATTTSSFSRATDLCPSSIGA